MQGCLFYWRNLIVFYNFVNKELSLWKISYDRKRKYEADLGRKLENIVFFELYRRGGKVFVGKHNDREIDFVVQKANNEREYYQVAYTVNDEKTFNREISAFDKIKDNYPKFLLTLDYDKSNINGIQRINVIDWLLMWNINPYWQGMLAIGFANFLRAYHNF